jgi:uncharacterized protein YdhG (YjbR/CyaY superfamily)
MTAAEIDAYLAGLEEPKRSTLEELRRRILNVIPEAEQTISYKMPAFRIDGKVVAGFAAFKHHLAYLPHSGSVFEEMAEDLTAYTYSKGSLRFPVDEPLPQNVVNRLIEIRLHQAGP